MALGKGIIITAIVFYLTTAYAAGDRSHLAIKDDVTRRKAIQDRGISETHVSLGHPSSKQSVNNELCSDWLNNCATKAASCKTKESRCSKCKDWCGRAHDGHAVEACSDLYRKQC